MPVQAGEILLGIFYSTLWLTLQCDLKFSLIIYLPIQALTWWFRFYWFLYIDKKNVKRGIGKGGIHQLRDFKHKGKHKICMLPKISSNIHCLISTRLVEHDYNYSKVSTIWYQY